MNFKRSHKPLLNTMFYVLDTVPSNVLKSLEKPIDKIKQNFYSSVHMGQSLIGHIDHEYVLKIPNKVKLYIKDIVNNLDPGTQGYLQPIINHFPDKKPQFSFSTAWVNFQQKYEYNPPHIHSGLYSYVIWYKIPYLLEDELKVGPGKIKQTILKYGEDNYVEGFNYNDVNMNGCFSFICPDNNGLIKNELLPVDNKWEGTIALFPSVLYHSVYPFYSSDDYRITISGNIDISNLK